jgi:hypothetical protein
MASFVAVKPLPASSCFVVQRPGLGFGRARQSSVARIALPDLRLRLPSVRCSAEEGEPEVAEKRGVSLEKPEEEAHSPSEEFGGWSAAESEQGAGGSWKAGAFSIL